MSITDTSAILISLKIGRNSYEITASDEFMDNGCCVQLLTQNKGCGSYGHNPPPLLSMRAVKELNSFERVSLNHDHGTKVQVFTIKAKNYEN